MRRMGYVAAAAAGMIVPLAIALPAVASTQSPLLAGVSSILDDGNGDGIDDDFYDGNGDGINDNDDNNDDNDWDDNGFDDNDFDDNGFDDNGFDDNDNGDGDVSVAASGSSGDLAILLAGSDLASRTDYSIASPGLEAACESSNLNGVTVESGRTGNFEVLATTSDCAPGTYDVIITDEDSFESAIVDLHVD